MVFSSLSFIFFFLPSVLAVYYLSPQKWRNCVLLLFSYLFYVWGSGWFLLVLVFSTLIDYGIGRSLDKLVGRKRDWAVGISITMNLSLLFYFKYTNFLVSEINTLLFRMEYLPVEPTNILLPIGLSFFTFQKITYIFDVYRRIRKAFKNFTDYALYVAMFPQLVAGPIVRFHEISDQIISRKETVEKFYRGILRFCLGLIKKAVLANSCGEIADAVFILESAQIGTSTAWIGIFAYTLQIYFDFSAYSDMAIGLGEMFGLKLPENFNRPYSAVTITDFWRRWHITLSCFFRDYVYIPLGGNRRTQMRVYVNLLIVFVLCGVWHGANWTFLAWGVFHGGLLILERVTELRTQPQNMTYLPRRVLTFILIMTGWVLFRSSDLSFAYDYLYSLYWYNPQSTPLDVVLALNERNLFFLGLSSLVILLSENYTVRKLVQIKTTHLCVIRDSCILVGTLYALVYIAAGSYNPFIYYQF